MHNGDGVGPPTCTLSVLGETSPFYLFEGDTYRVAQRLDGFRRGRWSGFRLRPFGPCSQRTCASPGITPARFFIHYAEGGAGEKWKAFVGGGGGATGERVRMTTFRL